MRIKSYMERGKSEPYSYSLAGALMQTKTKFTFPLQYKPANA
jgi:hypothetical protein